MSNDMTVTMSMNQYLKMQKKIEQLEDNNILKFAEREYPGDPQDGPYHDLIVDTNKIRKVLTDSSRYVQNVDFV